MWWGGYYLTGEQHSYRRDKMKVAIYNGDIWVHEEGGVSQSLATWLVNNGRAADYREAYRILDCKGKPLDVQRFFEKRKVVASYVPRSVVDAMGQIDLNKCPLFRWMCTLFPEDRVREVWKMYNVTTDTKGNAVYCMSMQRTECAMTRGVDMAKMVIEISRLVARESIGLPMALLHDRTLGHTW